ncbi:MAG TPA: hypothetical protein VJ828_16460 [Lacipirellulaceae bacterium]|nr:hypothetical protein [Lacipirellulaceae bacterium]
MDEIQAKRVRVLETHGGAEQNYVGINKRRERARVCCRDDPRDHHTQYGYV